MNAIRYLVICLAGLPCLHAATNIYVAPNGSDDNQGTIAAPLATLEAAQQAVRQAKAHGPAGDDITVLLREGTYRPQGTLAFTVADSGEAGHPVVWKAYPGERATISGGVQVKGWTEDEPGRFVANVSLNNFRQLWVNGVRAQRARGQVPANLRHWGTIAATILKHPLPPGESGTPGYVPCSLGKIEPAGYTTTDTQIAHWRNPGDIEFGYYNSWSHMIAKVDQITPTKDGAIIVMAEPGYFLCSRKPGAPAVMPAYMENALELLKSPGQWYFDRSAKKLYYRPRPGEDLSTAEVIVPQVETLMSATGTLEHPVHDIRFQGLTFSYATWLRPSTSLGHPDLQANFIQPADNSYIRPEDNAWATVDGEAIKSPANVVLDAAHAVHFERCIFTALGGAGLDIQDGSSDNVVSGCIFRDISGSAIQVGDITREDHHPSSPERIVRDNQVLDNVITQIGVEYTDAIGVQYGYTDGTVIAHNEIYAVPYSGVSGGWGWGQPDAGGSVYASPVIYPTPTACRNNLVEFNNIHDTNLLRGDGGLVYMLSRQPGTVIRANYLHDSRCNGVYLDEGSSEITVVGNALNANYAFNNHAQNRIASCTIKGNYDLWTTDGIIGKALHAGFNIPAEARFNSPTFTVAAWMRLSDYTHGVEGRRWMIRKAGDQSDNGNISIFIQDRNFGAYINRGGGKEGWRRLITSTSPLPVGTWTHVAVTFDGKSIRLYHDGTKVADQTIDHLQTADSGRWVATPNTEVVAASNFPGDVDEMSFYNRPLSDAEIRQNVETVRHGHTDVIQQGLVQHWSFDSSSQEKAAQPVIAAAGLEPRYRDLMADVGGVH